MIRGQSAFLVVSTVFLGFALRAETAPTKPTLSYDRDIRPILSDNCFKCHGPAAKEAAAGLRLDIASSATKDRGGYFAIKPGKPGQSMVLARVTTTSSEMKMPPASSGKATLTKAQVELLTEWIRQGAKYEPHWSFVPPAAPALPVVKNEAWCRNPVDRFVLAKLEASGLKPESQADPTTLLRRASLSLTGLPPTPVEMAQLKADKSAMAYENAVDRLLASPRYGEHQARYWLDAVRYGDTHGLHLDNERAIYPYRDWVVRAFNSDLPFDKFTTWQLAGDLLPNPTTEQLIATGYIRMNPTTSEGGAIEEEFQAKNTFDRVETTSTVFLGMTTGCARCHDHKFDPISQREYYQLFAYFNSTVDKPLDGNELTPAPVIRAATPEQDKQLVAMRAKLRAAEAKVSQATADNWVKTAYVPLPVARDWEISQAYPSTTFDLAFSTEFGPEPGGTVDASTWKPIAVKTGVAANNVVGKENAAVFVRGKIKSEAARDFELRVGSDDAVKVWFNGVLLHDNKVLRGLTEGSDKVKVQLKPGDNDVLLKVVNASGPDGFTLSFGDALSERIEAVTKGSAKPGYKQEVVKLYLEAGPTTPEALAYRKTLVNLTSFEQMLPYTLVAEELPKPRPANILRRGEYDQKEGVVVRKLPAFLGISDKAMPKDRLAFARWLVSPGNPLVSRVFVNRVWQQHFGVGIVKTAEDYGNQGEWPSHPELLDYLSTEFIRQGWSLKKLHRMIVTSAAFRQQAVISAEKKRRDPENRLVSRGPRYRLDAEVIRDQALYVAGILKEQHGGKGVKPYQPSGLWEAIAFPDSNTARYVQDKGDSLYRRSIYIFWKRTSPPPAMLTFDAPLRESCVVRRSRTNTPLQALVVMNDPAYFEAAREFAERLIATKPKNAERLNLAFRLALGREPTPIESKLLLNSLSRYQGQLTKESARKLLTVGEMPSRSQSNPIEAAAWTLVTSTIFNTDEFLTLH